MNKRLVIMLLIIIAGMGLGGYYAGTKNLSGMNRKPVITPAMTVKNTDKIVMEKEYRRCGHVIMSDYDQKYDLTGKSLNEIEQLFNSRDGFKVSIKNKSVVIRQVINDWCPHDYERCRLKAYQGKIGVYQGPNAQNDELIRITAIKISTLPQNVQQHLNAGKYEFADQESLNDALENLDEYLQ